MDVVLSNRMSMPRGLWVIACAGCVWALAGGCALNRPEVPGGPHGRCAWTLDHGGIVRGDVTQKRIALIFTGGEHGEGTGHILEILNARGIKASFFVTGHYMAKEEYAPGLRRMASEGHYVGPHSDSHPLYCSWEDRSRTLVSREFFAEDLRKNMADLRRFGALPDGQEVYFIPPYEWFNADQVAWSRELGVVLFNFTPGSGSNRDWIPEGHRGFVSSQVIVDDILAYERREQQGLNGFFLLLHLGSQRVDKTHLLLGELVDELRARGYAFVRVDQLLGVRG